MYEQKEIDDEAIPMKDALNLLEKFKVIENSTEWDTLREIRNILSHEYPFDVEEKIENIQLALQGYEKLKQIYQNLKNYSNGE